MTRTASHLCLGAFLLLLGACASTPPTTVLIEDDSACPLTLHAGQTLILNLPSNPASGYRWQVREAAEQVLEPLGPEVFRTPEDGVIGGDGISTWRFQVRRIGEDQLHLAYAQAWDEAAVPADEFRCQLAAR